MKRCPTTKNLVLKRKIGDLCSDFDLLYGLEACKHYSIYKSLWKSVNPNCKICIIADKVVIECVALLYSGIVLFPAQGLTGANGDFGLVHGLWAWKHYFTYKLV